MENYYKLFMKVILKEIKKFQLDTEVYSTYLYQHKHLASSLDQNFDVPYNRCAYMYKYGTNNIHFFKDCVDQFLLNYENAKDLLSEWKSHTDVKVCSLSVGPGLDYLAFMVAILEYDSLPPNFTGAKIISQHGAWRNTVNYLMEVLREQGSIFDIAQSKLKYDTVNVIQADFLTYFSGKFTIASLNDAHIVLMVRTLNLKTAGDPQEGPRLQMLKVLISSLRSDVTIFCIDTKPSLAVFTRVFSNFPGRFLYGPTHRTTTAVVDFPEAFGCRPTITGRGVFFVWQKFPTNLSTPHPNATSANIECESNLKVAYSCGDDVSTLLNPSSIESESEMDSVNLPWIELKTFWKNSSPKTKKLLKKLMLLDKEKLENIEDFISLPVKVDSERNMFLTRMKTLDVAEPSFSQETTLSPVGNLDNMSDCSYTFVTAKSIDDTVKSLPTVTLNSENNLIHENITLPGRIQVSTSVLSSSEKQSNNDAPAEIGSIKAECKSEEYTIVEDIDVGISSHEKVTIANPHESQSSTSVMELTDCIRQLVSSVESMTQQNEPPDKLCNGSPNNSPRQPLFASNSRIYDVPSCSKHSYKNGSAESNNLPPNDCAVEKKGFQCNYCHFSCQCCQNRCNLMQCNYESSCCHFKPCCSHSVPRYAYYCSRLYREGEIENTTSPNIVIPLQNISEDVLLKIITVLKSDRKFC